MNFSSVISNLPSVPFGGGLVASHLVDDSKALARLSGAFPTSISSEGSSPIQPMFQTTMQLAEMLMNLMAGQPAPIGRNSSHPVEKIQGGQSIYATGMFHKGAKGAPNTYAFENSPAGIQFAAEHGYSSIDLDMQITKDGVPVATHWSQPMAKDGFFDPEHKLRPNTKVSDMTLAEVMRLRNKDGQSRIFPVETMIAELKKHGIAGDLEAKDDPRFASDEVMGYLADLVRQSGVKANLKSIDRGGRSDKILQVAQSHGFWVRTAEGGGKPRRNIGYGS